MSLTSLQIDLSSSESELASCRHRLSLLETANLRLGSDLDDSISAERTAHASADDLDQELSRCRSELENTRARLHRARTRAARVREHSTDHRGYHGDEGSDSGDGDAVASEQDRRECEQRREEIDNVSLLGELLQLKEQVALQNSMCSTVPFTAPVHLNRRLSPHDADDVDCSGVGGVGDGGVGSECSSAPVAVRRPLTSSTAVSSPPEYKRLFEEIFRTLRRRPTTAREVNLETSTRSVATNTE